MLCPYTLPVTYVEIIVRGKKEYFYLTKNVRTGTTTWKKIRVYLGNKRPTQQQIRDATTAIEERSPQLTPFTYLTAEDAEILQDLKEGYNAWLKRTPESLKKKLSEDFIIRFTYHSNAIEGNKLTLRETALILKENVIPSGVRANDYSEAINGRECLELLKTYKGGLSNKLLEKTNGILTKNTGTTTGGSIREFNVTIEGSSHAPPAHRDVKKHLLNLYKWYSANKHFHAFELAAIIHHKITWIHPFEDGNGRTARAIMNWILMKEGYPMFFIPIERRQEYYAALETADRKKHKSYLHQMLQLIIDQVKTYKKNDE